MSARGLIVDGVDLGALGVGLSEVSGRNPDRSADWPTVGVPGRDGEVLVASQPSTEPRILDLRLVIDAATRAAALALAKNVRWYLHERAAHVFRFADDETTETTGYVVSRTYPAIAPDISQTAMELRVRVKCPDPREYAVSDTVVSGITTSDVDVPLGADRCEPVLVVTGAAAFTITYKDSGGVTVKALEIAGATSPVTIDMAAGTIIDGGGDAIALMTAASDFPWSLDPLDGDYPAADWPTLTVDSGTLVATYRKAY